MTDLAQWIAIIVTLFNGAISYIDRKIIRIFKKYEATSSDAPIRSETFKPWMRWRLKRNNHSGIRRIGNSNFYYFDENLYRAKKRSRFIRVIIIFSILLILFVSIYFTKQ